MKVYNIISCVCRIIDGARSGDQELVKRYSMRLVQQLRDAGDENAARAIECRFEENPRYIVQDEESPT